MRRSLLILLGAVLSIAMFSPAMASPSGVVDYVTVNPVTVQAMGLDIANPVVGQTITAGAKLVAASPITFDRITIAVRDSAGANYDFPTASSWSLGTSQKELKSARTFTKTDTYTTWVAYYYGGRWTSLAPKRTFTLQTAPTSTTTPMPNGPTGTWTLKFGDEFNGTSVDWTKWSPTSLAESDGGHGNPGNQQLEWNQAANVSEGNGVVTLTAKPDSITSPYTGRHYDWSSGLLSSEKSFSFQYGYIEERAQFPSVKGFWPGFWTYQAPNVNQWIETDAYEYYSDNHTKLYLTQHSGTGGSYAYTPPFDPAAGFHTYGADIKPTGTDFYVDGVRVYSTQATSNGLTNVLTDLFVYSAIPPDPGTVATKKVDYIRVWQD